MLYNETICIQGVRGDGRKIAVPALPCRFLDDGVDDFASENGRGYNANMATFFVPIAEWTETKPPQVGDEILTDLDERYIVTRVSRLADSYSIAARGR